MHNPKALFTYCFKRENLSSDDLALIESHIEICNDCQKELLLIFGTPWLIPPLERLERKKLADSDSYFDRFRATFQTVLSGDNRPNGYVYWDISSLSTLKQLLIVGQATFDLPLIVTISGGAPESLNNIKSIFQSSLSSDGPKMGYKWHVSKKKAVQYKDFGVKERNEGAWPQVCNHESRCFEFSIRSAADDILLAASGHKIVIFLPEDKNELEEHWGYYFGSWVMMIWEEREGEQQSLINQLLNMREEELTRPLRNPYDERYFPWIFKIDPNGNIRIVTAAICRGIKPLPNLIGWHIRK